MRNAPVKLLLLTMGACTAVDDGAVELSWTFRPASSSLPDKFVDCNANDEPGSSPVAAVKLTWTVGGVEGAAQWPCQNHTGATKFELPPGSAVLTVSPVCSGDIALDPASFIAPAPYQREVTTGDVVSLGAVELVLQVESCEEQPCICHP